MKTGLALVAVGVLAVGGIFLGIFRQSHGQDSPVPASVATIPQTTPIQPVPRQVDTTKPAQQEPAVTVAQNFPVGPAGAAPSDLPDHLQPVKKTVPPPVEKTGTMPIVPVPAPPPPPTVKPDLEIAFGDLCGIRKFVLNPKASMAAIAVDGNGAHAITLVDLKSGRALHNAACRRLLVMTWASDDLLVLVDEDYPGPTPNPLNPDTIRRPVMSKESRDYWGNKGSSGGSSYNDYEEKDCRENEGRPGYDDQIHKLNRTLRFYDAKLQELKKFDLPNLEGQCTGRVETSANGPIFVYSDSHGGDNPSLVRTYDLNLLSQIGGVVEIKDREPANLPSAISPDGSLKAVCYPGRLTIYSTGNGALLKTLAEDTPWQSSPYLPCVHLRFSKDGRFLEGWRGDGQLTHWRNEMLRFDLETGTCEKVNAPNKHPSLSKANYCKWHDEKQLPKEFEQIINEWPNRYVISADGRTILYGGYDGPTLRVYRAKD